jgi:hypothetical protein
MTRDIALLAFLVLAFATLLTAHLALALAMARRGHRSRALAALVIVPIAPYLGWRDGFRFCGALWMAAAISYSGALWLAMR